jgi:hypothetical protein
MKLLGSGTFEGQPLGTWHSTAARITGVITKASAKVAASVNLFIVTPSSVGADRLPYFQRPHLIENNHVNESISGL